MDEFCKNRNIYTMELAGNTANVNDETDISKEDESENKLKRFPSTVKPVIQTNLKLTPNVTFF